MTIAESDIRTMLPAAVSGRANQVPKQAEHKSGTVLVYVGRSYTGSTYVVPSTELEKEEDAAVTLAALRDAAEALEVADYPDSPEHAQERTDLTRALYQLQVEAISAREDREQ